MKNFKEYLFYFYLLGALIMIAVDIISNYGDDSLVFWVVIRPFVALFKGIIWPFVVLHSL